MGISRIIGSGFRLNFILIYWEKTENKTKLRRKYILNPNKNPSFHFQKRGVSYFKKKELVYLFHLMSKDTKVKNNQKAH